MQASKQARMHAWGVSDLPVEFKICNGKIQNTKIGRTKLDTYQHCGEGGVVGWGKPTPRQFTTVGVQVEMNALFHFTLMAAPIFTMQNKDLCTHACTNGGSSEVQRRCHLKFGSVLIFLHLH